MHQGSHGPVAVVGARGFLGGALTRALLPLGSTVIELTREHPPVRESRLDPRLHDVSTVYWMASSINPKVATEHPELVDRDRREFRQFLDLMQQRRADARIVLLSSGGTVYDGAVEPPYREDMTSAPRTPYGRAKLDLERILQEHWDDAVVLRVSNAYGAGQHPAPGQGVIGHWLRAVAADEPIVVFGPLQTVRDYIHVDDVINAVLRSGSTTTVPTCINVGSGLPTSLGQILDVIRAVVAPSKVQVIREPARSFDTLASWLVTSRARETLGWQPRVTLTDGVASMWDWVNGG